MPSDLPEEHALVAALLGSLGKAIDELTPGKVRVWGDSGLEEPIGNFLAGRGFTVDPEARQVIDLGAELLSTPERFKELPDEAVVVCIVHPERPPQSLDLYSTIHRYSHRILFRAWGPAPLESVSEVRLRAGDWMFLDA
jgi:hypothetical protein